MLVSASLSFRHIAGKENDNSVKIGICQAPRPMIGMIGTRCAEDIRPSGHPLTKLFRKSSQRHIIDAESLQAIPCKGDGYPSGIELARPNRLCRPYFREHASQPGSAAFSMSKTKEFVTRSKGRRACNQEMLDVIEL
jgi:ribosomal protein S14